MKVCSSRRDFIRLAACVGAAFTSALPLPARSQTSSPGAQPSLQLGLASYTFRNFSRDQMIGFMKQIHISSVNAKDVKDHLPMDSVEEAKALADYTAAAIKVTAAGTIYFPKDEDTDIRAKFEYAKRAGISVIVAGDPSPQTLPRVEKFVKEYDIRLAIHNHGPEDKLWHSPLDVLKVVKDMDPRIGCCIDVGHTMRAGTDVVQAIHEVGPRLFDVHMKDLADAHSKESQVAVGEGIMPVKKIFEALLATNYKGQVDLEYEIHAEDPVPGVLSSFAYMRGVLAGMS